MPSGLIINDWEVVTIIIPKPDLKAPEIRVTKAHIEKYHHLTMVALLPKRYFSPNIMVITDPLMVTILRILISCPKS